MTTQASHDRDKAIILFSSVGIRVKRNTANKRKGLQLILATVAYDSYQPPPNLAAGW